MKKMFRRIISKLIRLFIYESIDYNFLQNKLDEIKVNNCYNVVTIGKNSKFYKQSEIHNNQNDNSKIVIGENTHILGELLIFGHGGNIIIGNNSYISLNSFIRSAESITIGNDVLISHNCNIFDTNSHEINYLERAETHKYVLKNGFPKDKYNVISAPIIIEDHVWISFNVIILKGVTIGKGAIVAAGSVVTKNVEPFTMVAGNPAKFIKYIS